MSLRQRSSYVFTSAIVIILCPGLAFVDNVAPRAARSGTDLELFGHLEDGCSSFLIECSLIFFRIILACG